MYISESECANFGLQVLTDLYNRRLQDIFIFCTDNLRNVTKNVVDDELLILEEKWSNKYPVVMESGQRNWEQLSNIFNTLNLLERSFTLPMPQRASIVRSGK